jgi:uncharacterized protein YfiM (DUF2279 family)
MNQAAMLVCLCLRLGGQPAAPDRWLAEDKWKHLFASFVVTSIAGGSARALGMDADASVAAGAAAGVGAGIWKELRDRRNDSPFSARDLVWDAVGVGGAAALLAQTR